MVFKLVRIDTVENNIIELPLGAYSIGKGKLLGCDDEQVAFKHGKIIVTRNKLTIKAHENKLYFTKKGAKKKEVFNDCTKRLRNGDSFGLLSNSYWYEVVHCTTDKENQEKKVLNTRKLDTSKVENNNHEYNPKNDWMLKGSHNDSLSEFVNSAEESSNLKRSCSPEDDCPVKKRKINIKRANADGLDGSIQPRERCKYGATCYSLRSLRRKHSEHKAQYSHPRDPDWDPVGARRQRRDYIGRVPSSKTTLRRKRILESDTDCSLIEYKPKVLRKRAPKTIPEDSEAPESAPEDADPFASDDSEDWVPSSPELHSNPLVALPTSFATIQPQIKLVESKPSKQLLRLNLKLA